MKFIFIYGAPAVGKLTIARELSRLTGYRLFDNHLVVDAVLALYDFGSPQFVALREAIWRTSFTALAHDPEAPDFIFTFNPENSVAQDFIDDLFRLFAEVGADVRCIELTAPESAIESRLAAIDRREKRKLVDVELYRTLRASGAFLTPVITHNRMVIDTSLETPMDAARKIAASLNE